MTIEVSPLCAHLGVVVTGIDFAQPVSETLAKRLVELWRRHGLLLIKGENVSPEAQIEFSRMFGRLEAHPLKTIRADRYPELMELNSEDSRTNPVAYWDGRAVIGRLPWHKDLIYTTKPNHGAVLRAVRIPDSDGETGYGDLQSAYEALPAAMKKRAGGLEVVYRFAVKFSDMPFVDTTAYAAGPDAPQSAKDLGFPEFPDAMYPLVLTHPLTGAKSLNISPMFLHHVHGIGEAESTRLLTELVAHATRPEFCYLHKWTPGEMILWDNWRFMHSAPGISPGDHRIIHRTTILGGQVLGRVA